LGRFPRHPSAKPTLTIPCCEDPYHDNGQAHGLAFSVLPGIKIPPSLRNMYKELNEDKEVPPLPPSPHCDPLLAQVKFKTPTHGNLQGWADQGVLLLNTCLTVEVHALPLQLGPQTTAFRPTRPTPTKSKVGNNSRRPPHDPPRATSACPLDLKTPPEAIVDQLNRQYAGIVFLLWGKPAEARGKAVNRGKHCVLTGPHPSPLSAHRGYFGCQHFSKCNEYLVKNGQEPIDWQV
jgi:uracil-DNA glycosylase